MDYRKIKKTIGFFEKWTREMVFNKNKNSKIDICVDDAYHYIDMLRPHTYEKNIKNILYEESIYDISVIVPIYNAEKYLEECINSVLKQCTHCNFEILLINDGSTDSSGYICDRYTYKFPKNIKAYHIDNMGIANARNFGLEKAKGKYIYFLDSDDILLNISDLYDNALKHDADIVEGNFIIFKDSESLMLSSVHLDVGDIPVSDISNDFNLLQSSAGFVWGKLYKRSLWDDTMFPVGFVFEDTIEEVKILRKARRYMFLSSPCQAYRSNPESICHTVNSTERCLDSLLVYRYWIETSSDEELKDPVFFRQVLKQFGSKTYSRISERPEKELKCSLVIMKDLLEKFSCKTKLTFFEKVMLRQIMNLNYAGWKFMCKYCFL